MMAIGKRRKGPHLILKHVNCHIFPLYFRIHNHLDHVDGERCVLSAIYQLYETSCHNNNCPPVSKCFGGVSFGARRMKEGVRMVAYRCFINLSLKCNLPPSQGKTADIVSLFEESKHPPPCVCHHNHRKSYFLQS